MKTLATPRPHRHHLALHRGRVDVRLGHPGPRPPLLLDWHAGVLAWRGRLLLGAGTDSRWWPMVGALRLRRRSPTHSVPTTPPGVGAWLIAHAFGNFLGAGVWGFMQTLPQINLYTHGTAVVVLSHGHLAFFGAYVTIIVAFVYIALQKLRGDVWMSAGLHGGWRWKWSLGVAARRHGRHVHRGSLIAGYEQSFIERAVGGSTWQAYFDGQTQPWFVEAMWWRMVFGVVMTSGPRHPAGRPAAHRSRRDPGRASHSNASPPQRMVRGSSPVPRTPVGEQTLCYSDVVLVYGLSARCCPGRMTWYRGSQ